jgi:hypothetical protein
MSIIAEPNSGTGTFTKRITRREIGIRGRYKKNQLKIDDLTVDNRFKGKISQAQRPLTAGRSPMRVSLPRLLTTRIEQLPAAI